MRHTALSTSVLLMVAASLLAGRPPQSGTPGTSELLARTVTVASLPQTVSMAFQSLMLTAGIPGGEATTAGACREEPKVVVRLQGTTLEEALDSITRSDPRYRWKVSGGVVDLLPGGMPPALLRTRVDRFDSGSATDIVSAGTSLFALPSVRSAAASLGLMRNATGNGLGSMLPGPQPRRKRLGLHLHDVTVLEALNAIVRTNGHGVWIYTGSHCNGTHLFDLNFAQ